MEAKGFVIRGTTFQKYEGSKVEVLEIPEGITEIEGFSLRYSNLKGCKKIVFPTSLKVVGRYALNYDYGDCSDLEELEFLGDVDEILEEAFDYVGHYDNGKKGLRRIVFHGKVGAIHYAAFNRAKIERLDFSHGIDSIGKYAFNACCFLKEIHAPGLKKIGNSAFNNCANLEIVDIPSSTVIGEDAFSGCKKLEKDGVAVLNGVLLSLREGRKIPDKVITIGKYALNGSVRIPLSVRTIQEQTYNANMILEDGFLLTDEKLGGKGLINHLKYSKLNVQDVAAIYLFQTGKQFDEITSSYMRKETDALINEMIQLLTTKGKAKHYMRAIEFAISNVNEISTEQIQALYDVGSQRNYTKEQKHLVQYLSLENKCETKECQDIYAPWRSFFNEHLLDKSIKANRGESKLFENVKLSGTTEIAPAYIVKCAIVPYLDQYTGRPKHIGGYKTDYIEVKLVELADKAASLLDINDLQKLLEQQYEKGGSAWLLPYGKFASGTQVTSLIASMRKWEDWRAYGSSGRSDIITARGALMLSDTREAMMNLEKKGLLGSYAAIRGMDADSIRDTVLAEFGLDSEGKKVYDLGTKRIIVSLTTELTLSLFDEFAQKEIKSIPKKGTDPDLAEKAATDFAEMKKNVKKVVKGRNDVLFDDFLSGRTRSAASWISSYTKNPLLRQVAKLIVWVQGKTTFTLTETGAIDCNKTEYVIDNNTEIGVAHPIEMKQSEIEAWQKYFSTHGLKQPFSQIWEPAVDKASITEDRYKGCLIPFYRFRGQSKHGISVEDYDFHNEIYISFNDCDATVERIDWRRHEINNEDNFEVTSFQFRKYNRRVNHIVAYLDKVTIIGRILKDDVSIATFLSQFTLAQIAEFIKLAIENNCTNVTAILLDHQQKAFHDFDPMAEFTLDL